MTDRLQRIRERTRAIMEDDRFDDLCWADYAADFGYLLRELDRARGQIDRVRSACDVLEGEPLRVGSNVVDHCLELLGAALEVPND